MQMRFAGFLDRVFDSDAERDDARDDEKMSVEIDETRYNFFALIALSSTKSKFIHQIAAAIAKPIPAVAIGRKIPIGLRNAVCRGDDRFAENDDRKQTEAFGNMRLVKRDHPDISAN